MFTGDVTAKKINLGGASKPLDRASLIEKQRLDRLHREIARRREDACMRIQKNVRGHLVRLHTLMVWANTLIVRLQKLEAVPEQRSCEEGRRETSTILSLMMFLKGGTIDVTVVGRLCGIYMRTGIVASPTVGDILKLGALIRHAMVYPELFEAISGIVSTVPYAQRTIRIDRIDKTRLFGMLPNQLTHEILRSSVSREFILAALEAGVDLLPVVDIFEGVFPCGSDGEQRETTALILARLWINAPQIVSLDDWLLHAVGEQCSASTREKVQSIILSGLAHCMSLDIRRVDVLVAMINFEAVSDDWIFGIAVHSNLVQALASKLVELLLSNRRDDYVRRTIDAFTFVYSRIAGAAFRGAINTETIEQLFPLLNQYVYAGFVSRSNELVNRKLVTLVKSVHSKKHLYPNLRSDSVWVIPGSVGFIPTAVNSYEIIDRLEREEELQEGEEHQFVFHSSESGRVFEILIEEIPHVIPFENRLRIFASTLAEDQLRQRQTRRFPWNENLHRVRRNRLVEDGLRIIEDCSREVVRIEFVSGNGSLESGIDGGGLFKEFMQQWTLAMMTPETGLFQQLPNGRLSPMDAINDARLYRACGKAVGKALYEMVLLETHFGESFLNRVLGKPFDLENLFEVDETLFNNLKFLFDCETVEDLSLTFSIGLSNANASEEIDLIPNGRNIPVTRTNTLRYVLLASWFHLSRKLDKPAAAFAAGLS